ncbi:hypothetical protein LPJ61_001519 [Coemansia biformis]|uniref:Uncharacterized protein n=1 Tax=Coemansia biformis TaxID=1286918 RepID=A0A9W7YHI4_9FUNG|nr:hypothetical protein LPJ61_001519 [Coemansia biformis]
MGKSAKAFKRPTKKQKEEQRAAKAQPPAAAAAGGDRQTRPLPPAGRSGAISKPRTTRAKAKAAVAKCLPVLAKKPDYLDLFAKK